MTEKTDSFTKSERCAVRKILVVEDDREVRGIVEDFLKAEPLRPIGCSTGAEAIDWRLSGNDADLMLLDLGLPDMSGKDLVSALREKGGDLPFVVTTGQEDAKVAVEMMKLGALDYIQKGPGFFDYLLPVVRQAIEDIDREKRLRIGEEEQARLRERVHQAQREESLGVLARGIAHNFNNILSTIIGYTRLAMDDVSRDSLTHANLNEVLRAGDRAKILVEQMLEFGRASEPEREPLDLREAVSEALDTLEGSLPRAIRIECNLDVENAAILANKELIDQMLVNLFENAVTAMADGGGILGVRLTTWNPDPLAESGPVLPQEGRHAVLTITDTGAGMAPEVRKRIFEPFFTTKSIGNGTGMGLAVVHGVVTSHGGAIEVRSKLGEGAKFHVYLPQVPEGARSKKERVEGIPCGGERILVVDDEKPLVRLVDQILSRHGYRVTTEVSSTDALATFAEAPEEFDAVVTDMLMPDLQGDDMARRMLTIRPNIPIVLMTGSDIEKASAEAITEGLTECLRKPFTPESLCETVSKALEFSNE